MTTPEQNMVFPPSAEVWFCFKSDTILKLPSFLFLRLILDSRPHANNDEEFTRLSFWADDLPQDQCNQEILSLITYLQTHVPWRILSPFVTLSPDSSARIASMWRQKRNALASYRIEIRHKQLPPQLYRYAPFNPERLEHLFTAHELYLPSPSQFNDPFDCSLDEETRLTFIECGMGCFSAKNDNILMFSHYADHHRGICLGVDPVLLAGSMTDPTTNISADIRPIWYFNTMPPIEFNTQPALCATCKHDVWSYEEEYRLFLVKGSSLLSAGLYSFKPESLRSVVFGCRASDECISFVKSVTKGISHLRYYKAFREPNRFGVKLLGIRKL
jgi:hypothetical protein